MENKKEFKPFIPADQVLPEFTVTSIILGIILAVVFGGANAYSKISVGIKSWYDGICFHSGSGYLNGCDSGHPEERLNFGKQHGTDNRFSR